MKKLVLFLILVGLVCVVPPAHAQQRYALGFGNAALKVDWFHFTDGSMDDMGVENGVYVGLEAYYALSCVCPNLYVGMEVGWAGSSNTVDFGPQVFARTDLNVDYVPIEFNAKYAFNVTPTVVFDLGAGISTNYINFDLDVGNASFSSNDWLFGGQFFADVNYKFAPNWFAGVNFKYQITQEIELEGINTNTSADNVRLGGQIGYNF